LGSVAQVDPVNTTPAPPLMSASKMEGQPPSLFLRGIALLLGAIFVYAGVLKAIDPIRFAGDIDNYHVIPWTFGVRLAFFLPWLEILCGLALIFRRLYVGAVAILSALTIVFITATIAAKVRGIDVSCGCFGHASKYLSFAGHLALDFVILAGLVFLLRGAFSREPSIR
jgi:putative oxidoreductase